MLLRRLELHNFRAFYGTTVLEFASGAERRVTVIHGENGAGKTNLLNAIYWCLTGDFTPRLSNPELLVSKAAREENRSAEAYVEVLFEQEGIEYRVRRTSQGRQSRFEVFRIERGNSKPISNGVLFLEKIVPKALSRWFFFDAEAIGELELSGSEDFKRSLRRTLGFELVDTLVEDLQICLTRRQRDLNKLVKSKDLDEIQERIENIQLILPGQKKALEEVEAQQALVHASLSKVDAQLRELPKSRPLQERRNRLEGTLKARGVQKNETQASIARLLGEASPAVLAHDMAIEFESRLQVKENQGKLPSPYSDQLVNEILESKRCVCGRPVMPGTEEQLNIEGLLKYAATGSFNARIRSIQLALRDIQGVRNRFPEQLQVLRQRHANIDGEIAEIDDELKDIKQQLEQIDEDAINRLESDHDKLQNESRSLAQREGVLANSIKNNEAQLRDFQLRYDTQAKKAGQGDAVRKELAKIKKIADYISATLNEQEKRALKVLQIELNLVLDKYLTKHYTAQINPDDYEVRMLDAKGREVGRSTGEGQVLKFAFISTVVALAGRKTQEKIDFMAEPTVAPLVLDAPFSALDPEYQGSVANNLATQSTQLVLLLSSAAWGESVSRALDRYIGRRYVLVSRQVGAKGDKPIKTMVMQKKKIALNEYQAERDESVIVELPV